MSNPYDSTHFGQQNNGDSQQSHSSEQQAYGQSAYGQQNSGPGNYSQTDYSYAMVNPNVVQNSAGQWVDVSQMKSNATVALILGILGLVGVLPLIGSLIAWIWGSSLQRQAAESGVPEDTVSSAKVAKILGIIGVVLVVIAVALFIVAIAFIASLPAE